MTIYQDPELLFAGLVAHSVPRMEHISYNIMVVLYVLTDSDVVKHFVETTYSLQYKKVLIRTQPTTFLQIFHKIILNFKVIIKSILGPDDNF